MSQQFVASTLTSDLQIDKSEHNLATNLRAYLYLCLLTLDRFDSDVFEIHSMDITLNTHTVILTNHRMAMFLIARQFDIHKASRFAGALAEMGAILTRMLEYSPRH